MDISYKEWKRNKEGYDYDDEIENNYSRWSDDDDESVATPGREVDSGVAAPIQRGDGDGRASDGGHRYPSENAKLIRALSKLEGFYNPEATELKEKLRTGFKVVRKCLMLRKQRVVMKWLPLQW